MTQLFNACEYLLDRRLAAGDGQRLALTGTAGELTYRQLHDRVCRTAAGLRAIGLQPEQRVLMLMADTPEFVTVYLAAMRAGAIPVPVSTMLRVDGVAELLTDSRARFLAVTREFTATAAEAAALAPELAGILADGPLLDAPVPVHPLEEIAAGPASDAVYSTTADSPAFWLYTSGTTGRAKAAMHRHGAIPAVCETYGTQVLSIRPDDRCLSSAKAFFAYGLGNSVLFPLSVGASGVLERAMSKPDVIAAAARDHSPTLFFAGPTFFAGMARLLAHEAVAQAVVVAAHDADGLEKPVAFVILQPGRSATEAELIEFCRQGLPSVKRPRKVVFTDSYPATSTGKVRRVELRGMADGVLVSGDPPAAAV